ncbi:MAG: DnaJ domain-containing protein [Thaumarchaeota archaeon]|nr:DnaJ domain-containing protein [Nitrososphaerota archaeon]
MDRFSRLGNLYEILGVSHGAGQQEIKKAYRAKARLTHPDRKPAAEKEVWEKRFEEVQEAYEILSNPVTRGDYDDYLASEAAGGRSDLPQGNVGGSPHEEGAVPPRGSRGEDLQGGPKNFAWGPLLGAKRGRMRIYLLAALVMTAGFGAVHLAHVYDRAQANPQAGGLPWQQMLENPQAAYCDPASGAFSRYCFYQDSVYTFDSDDGTHWYKWVNSHPMLVDLGDIPTRKTGDNVQAWSNAMGYHFCASKPGNYLVFENCLHMQTTLTNR